MGKSSTLPLTHSKSGLHFSSASLAAAAAQAAAERHEHSIIQQASLESADSRLCYLTSSEVGHVAFTLFRDWERGREVDGKEEGLL